MRPTKNTGKYVWFFNHYANPPDLPGGTRHFELATLLADLDWQSRIFATSFNHGTGCFERPTSPLHPIISRDESGVPFTWVYSIPYRGNGGSRYLNMASFFATSTLAGAIRTRPSVVVGSSPHLLGALGALFVSKLHRVPFVLEVRDLWPESLIQLGITKPVIVKPLWFIQRFLYKRARVVICLTDGIVDGVVARDVTRSKIFMIPNASTKPAPMDMGLRNLTRQELGWVDRVVVIWIGAHGPANSLEVLIEAARLLEPQSEILVVLVGDGSEKPQLQRLAADLANVQFLDPIPKADVQRILRAADLGVIVHRNTEAVRGARPNKLFDYMAASLPIVLNLDGEARSIVEDAKTGIFTEPESPQSLADALRHLSDQEETRQALGHNGFEYVSRVQTREETAAQLAQILDKVSKKALGKSSGLR